MSLLHLLAWTLYRQAALVDMLLFFGLLLLGFAYLWRFGYLDWVRTNKTAPAFAPKAAVELAAHTAPATAVPA